MKKDRYVVDANVVLNADDKPDEDDRVRWFRATTGIKNRNGYVVRPDGGDLTNFMKNPIIGWGHDVYHDAPMTNIIGKGVDSKQTKKALDIAVEFVPPEIHPYGELALQMVDAGFITSGSIGFYEMEGGFQKVKGEEVYVMETWELVEFSLVGIPANPEAQSLAFQLAMNMPGPPGLSYVDAAPPPIQKMDADDGALLNALAANVASTTLSTAFRRYRRT